MGNEIEKLKSENRRTEKNMQRVKSFYTQRRHLVGGGGVEGKRDSVYRGDTAMLFDFNVAASSKQQIEQKSQYPMMLTKNDNNIMFPECYIPDSDHSNNDLSSENQHDLIEMEEQCEFVKKRKSAKELLGSRVTRNLTNLSKEQTNKTNV